MVTIELRMIITCWASRLNTWIFFYTLLSWMQLNGKLLKYMCPIEISNRIRHVYQLNAWILKTYCVPHVVTPFFWTPDFGCSVRRLALNNIHPIPPLKKRSHNEIGLCAQNVNTMSKINQSWRGLFTLTSYQPSHLNSDCDTQNNDLCDQLDVKIPTAIQQSTIFK